MPDRGQHPGDRIVTAARDDGRPSPDVERVAAAVHDGIVALAASSSRHSRMALSMSRIGVGRRSRRTGAVPGAGSVRCAVEVERDGASLTGTTWIVVVAVVLFAKPSLTNDGHEQVEVAPDGDSLVAGDLDSARIAVHTQPCSRPVSVTSVPVH